MTEKLSPSAPKMWVIAEDAAFVLDADGRISSLGTFGFPSGSTASEAAENYIAVRPSLRCKPDLVLYAYELLPPRRVECALKVVATEAQEATKDT